MGIEHQRRDFNRQLPHLSSLQGNVEAKVLSIAKKEFHFTFSLVFYDVTTLYFESSEEDELRKPGYSKDNKPQQPQILVGLLVTPEGFPVAYQIFEGNTFEGHTLIPIISKFKRKHKIETLTVVADAAMISADNIVALKKSSLHYIVAARTAKLPLRQIREISAKLNQQDGRTMRIPTEEYGNLICEFSAKRFAKDKREMDKQIKKAEYLLNDPATIKRVKFIKPDDDNTYVLHTELIEKTTLLLGIKGYYTNLGPDVSDQLIIEHYHNLWHVEQAFRIAKSDLQMRPIYHFKQHAIRTHVLICFMALAVCKYMELKTGKSIKHIIKALKGVTDARIINTLSGEEIILRSVIKEETKQLLSRLNGL
jgi:transposase